MASNKHPDWLTVLQNLPDNQQTDLTLKQFSTDMSKLDGEADDFEATVGLTLPDEATYFFLTKSALRPNQVELFNHLTEKGESLWVRRIFLLTMSI